MYIDYDLDGDELISRLAGPLSPPDRIAAAAALLRAFLLAFAGMTGECRLRAGCACYCDGEELVIWS